jgi:hypothetical protein
MSDPITSPEGEDASDRVAEVTHAWESSPLTEPKQATDREAKPVLEHGDSEGDPAPAEPPD